MGRSDVGRLERCFFHTEGLKLRARAPSRPRRAALTTCPRRTSRAMRNSHAPRPALPAPVSRPPARSSLSPLCAHAQVVSFGRHHMHMHSSHPYPIPTPSLSHPYPIPIPSLSHPYPVPIPSLSHPYPIPIPSLSISHPFPSRFNPRLGSARLRGSARLVRSTLLDSEARARLRISDAPPSRKVRVASPRASALPGGAHLDPTTPTPSSRVAAPVGSIGVCSPQRAAT